MHLTRFIARASLQQYMPRGFTLVELLVVLAIVSTLLLLVAPRYIGSIDKSREVVLRENLHLVRAAIDQHYADTGRYPDSLDDLISKRYLRRAPLDPITERADTWVLVTPPENRPGQVFDIRSGSDLMSSQGSAYNSW